MYIDQIPSYNYYKNMNYYRPATCGISFQGTKGDEFVSQIPQDRTITPEDIAQMLTDLKLGSMGLVKMSNVTDLVESLVKKIQQMQPDVLSKQELDKQTQMLMERLRAADEFESLTRKQIQAGLEEEYAVKEQKLAEREQKLANDEKELMERLSAADEYFKMEEGALRLKYGISDEEVKYYVHNGEQMTVVTAMLNKKASILKNCDEKSIRDLVQSMRNKDGQISAEMIKAVKAIIELKNYCYVDDLPMIIKSIKDENGELDSVKYGYCISMLALKGTTYPGVLESMKEEFKLDESYTIEDIEETLKNGLSDTSAASDYSENIVEMDVVLESKIEYFSMERKQQLIEGIDDVLPLIEEDLKECSPDEYLDIVTCLRKMKKIRARLMNAD